MTRQSALPVLALIAAAALALTGAVPAYANARPANSTADTQTTPSFRDWLADFRAQAAEAGISEATLNATLTGLSPNPGILRADQRQPEFVQTFWNYLNARVTAGRIANGRAMLRQHAKLLHAVVERHGVPARYLVALWGLETNYGGQMGNVPLIRALATLAYDTRRPDFFRVQLLDALRMVDTGDVPASGMLGSWAGAFGHLQFIPSTFLRYAEDGDGDGKVNTRASLADALFSGGNYLDRAGWKKNQGWGREVRLPKDFDWSQARLDRLRPIAAWNAEGVTQVNGKPLPDNGRPAAIVLPQGYTGPAMLVQHNFYVLLRWNSSINYALSVAELADRLEGKPPFSTGLKADNRPLTHAQATDLQQSLASLGFDPGPVDGLPGRQTANAIRAYQAENGLPQDGYPSVTLLEKLRATLRQKSQPHPADPSPGSTAASPMVTPARVVAQETP